LFDTAKHVIGIWANLQSRHEACDHGAADQGLRGSSVWRSETRLWQQEKWGYTPAMAAR
jgi:hypothetical protein